MTGGMIGNGTMIGYRLVGSPSGAWTVVGQILNVGDLEIVRAKVDRTVMSGNIYKRSLPGMADVSDIPLSLLADADETSSPEGKAQHALRDFVIAGTTLNWRVEIPTTRDQAKFKPFEFDAYISKFKAGTAMQDKQLFDVNLVFDGDDFTEENATISPELV